MTDTIVITAGEPAGIGIDIVLQALQQYTWNKKLIVIADPELLAYRAKQLDIAINFQTYDPDNPQGSCTDTITVLPVTCPYPVIAGQLDANNAAYVLETLTVAAKGCLRGEFAAMVTAPIHKGIINEAGIKFSGHTEFLAELSDTKLPVMMLAADKLRVALATTHLPVSQVSAAITPQLLEDILTILHNDLQTKFAISKPHILVCGLNPHAGEGGHMGHEEIDTIEPTLDKMRQRGMQLSGPLPADTLFTPKYLDTADAVLAMYHDQGLPVLKYVGFGNAINITLGIPIIRTSVDHGTALDLAGTGKANIGSLVAAIDLADDITRLQKKLGQSH